MGYARRTDEDCTAELNAKIAGIQERAVRRAACADLIHEQARTALQAMGQALRDESEPSAFVTALPTERDVIREALRVHVPKPVAPVTAPRGRHRKAEEPATT